MPTTTLPVRAPVPRASAHNAQLPGTCSYGVSFPDLATRQYRNELVDRQSINTPQVRQVVRILPSGSSPDRLAMAAELGEWRRGSAGYQPLGDFQRLATGVFCERQ